MRRFKNEGFFFWFKKLKENKKLEMQKATKEVQKKKREIKNTCTQKEGKMEQEKTCVQKRKKKENKLKKGKEKKR